MVEDLMSNQSSQLRGQAEAWSNNHFKESQIKYL